MKKKVFEVQNMGKVDAKIEMHYNITWILTQT